MSVSLAIYLQIQSQDIRVGNLVWLRENDEVPCDLVLIGTSDPQGVCYVEVSKCCGDTHLQFPIVWSDEIIWPPTISENIMQAAI